MESLENQICRLYHQLPLRKTTKYKTQKCWGLHLVLYSGKRRSYDLFIWPHFQKLWPWTPCCAPVSSSSSAICSCWWPVPMVGTTPCPGCLSHQRLDKMSFQGLFQPELLYGSGKAGSLNRWRKTSTAATHDKIPYWIALKYSGKQNQLVQLFGSNQSGKCGCHKPGIGWTPFARPFSPSMWPMEFYYIKRSSLLPTDSERWPSLLTPPLSPMFVLPEVA